MRTKSVSCYNHDLPLVLTIIPRHCFGRLISSKNPLREVLPRDKTHLSAIPLAVFTAYVRYYSVVTVFEAHAITDVRGETIQR